MKTTQGAAHNYLMSTTQVPRPRIEPKTQIFAVSMESVFFYDTLCMDYGQIIVSMHQ